MNPLLPIIIPFCSWNNPGIAPYTDSFSKAISAYSFSSSYKEEILAKVNARKYDDVITITRISVTSDTHAYSPLYEMNFAKNRRCTQIDTSLWKNTEFQKALVYCSLDFKACIAIPEVCRNISRVIRKQELPPSKNPVSKPSAQAIINNVPEPSTFLLTILAILIMFQFTGNHNVKHKS